MGPATLAALVSLVVAATGDCVAPVVVYHVMDKKKKKKDIRQGVIMLNIPQIKRE